MLVPVKNLIKIVSPGTGALYIILPRVSIDR